MLVLSRKIGERIIFPETGVSISVLGVHGKRVRIGIEAPRTASVHREEVWRRIADFLGPDHAAEPIGETTQEVPRAVTGGRGAGRQQWLGNAEIPPLETT